MDSSEARYNGNQEGSPSPSTRAQSYPHNLKPEKLISSSTIMPQSSVQAASLPEPNFTDRQSALPQHMPRPSSPFFRTLAAASAYSLRSDCSLRSFQIASDRDSASHRSESATGITVRTKLLPNDGVGSPPYTTFSSAGRTDAFVAPH